MTTRELSLTSERGIQRRSVGRREEGSASAISGGLTISMEERHLQQGSFINSGSPLVISFLISLVTLHFYGHYTSIEAHINHTEISKFISDYYTFIFTERSADSALIIALSSSFPGQQVLLHQHTSSSPD